MKLRNESGLGFTDISSEVYREYIYADGLALTITDPSTYMYQKVVDTGFSMVMCVTISAQVGYG